MLIKFATLALALLAGLLVACGSHGTGVLPPSSNTVALPPIGDDLAITATLPKDTIGANLPSVLGTIRNPKWGNAVVGGYTQMKRSQTLAFPPGTRITIRNLSPTHPHTLDVIKRIKGKDADFPPRNTKLTFKKRGGDKLELGYASGTILPHKSVTVILAKAGTYLIGCAYHYKFGMHDILVVKHNPHPGPQATAPSTGGGSGNPSPSPSGYPQ